MKISVETKKWNKTSKSFLKVKNFLTAVKRQSSETTFLPACEVMYDKEDTSKELRQVYRIDTMYSYTFLAEHGILEWNGKKGKNAAVKWCSTESLDDLTIKIKNTNRERKNREETVQNPIKELVNRTNEDTTKSEKTSTKKTFFSLINKGFEENKKELDAYKKELENMKVQFGIIIKNQEAILSLLSDPMTEQSKNTIDLLNKFINNG